MSEPTGPSSAPNPAVRHPIAPGRHSVHISYIALRALRTLKETAIALVALGLAAIPRIEGVPTRFMALGLGGTIVVVVSALLGYSWLSYKRFTWELTADELHVYQGIIFKKETHVPFLRIHAIDYTAQVIERILGTVTIRIETAGGGAKAEAEIPALRLAEAEALRFEVFARKGRLAAADNAGAAAGPSAGLDVAAELGRLSESARGAFAGEYQDETPIDYEHRLTLPELALAGVSNSRTLLLLVAGIGALSQFMGILGGSDSAIIDYAQDAATRVLSYGMAVAIVVGVAALLVAWAVSISVTVISYGGFTVRRRGTRVEMEKGLLEHQFSGVAIDRIQSVRIQQGVLRRLIGFAEISLETVSSSGPEETKSGESGLVVHPFIRVTAVDAFIADLLPEFTHAPTQLAPLSRPARRRSIFRSTFWPVLIAVLVTVPFTLFVQPVLGIPVWVAPLVALVFLAPCPVFGHLSWKARGHAHDSTMLVFRSGAIALDTRLVPRAKIQWAKSTAGPFQRRLGLAGIAVWTAAGVGGSRIGLHDVGAEVAREILEWVEPRPSSDTVTVPQPGS